MPDNYMGYREERRLLIDDQLHGITGKRMGIRTIQPLSIASGADRASQIAADDTNR